MAKFVNKRHGNSPGSGTIHERSIISAETGFYAFQLPRNVSQFYFFVFCDENPAELFILSMYY